MGLKELAPSLVGDDPRQLLVLSHRMDLVLKGHPYVKSAVDLFTAAIAHLAQGTHANFQFTTKCKCWAIPFGAAIVYKELQ